MEEQTYSFIDKHTDIVIIASGKDEKEALKSVKERIKYIDTDFRVEVLEDLG